MLLKQCYKKFGGLYDDYSNWFVTSDLNPEEQINDIELRDNLKALKN